MIKIAAGAPFGYVWIRQEAVVAVEYSESDRLPEPVFFILRMANGERYRVHRDELKKLGLGWEE